jgi:hypothetical protein
MEERERCYSFILSRTPHETNTTRHKISLTTYSVKIGKVNSFPTRTYIHTVTLRTTVRDTRAKVKNNYKNSNQCRVVGGNFIRGNESRRRRVITRRVSSGAILVCDLMEYADLHTRSTRRELLPSARTCFDVDSKELILSESSDLLKVNS